MEINYNALHPFGRSEHISLRLHGRYLSFGTLSHAAALLFKPWGGFHLRQMVWMPPIMIA